MKIRKNGGAAVRKQGEKYRDQEPEIKEMETEKRERERGRMRGQMQNCEDNYLCTWWIQRLIQKAVYKHMSVSELKEKKQT